MMADEKKILRLLKTARGQMDGIIRMVEEDRYCIDISQQLMATEAILNRANKEILAAHLRHCGRTRRRRVLLRPQARLGHRPAERLRAL